MYSYLSLGENGQLGNQMFQYAALYSISKFNDVAGVIPDIDVQLYKAFQDLSLNRVPKEKILSDAKWLYEPNEALEFTFDKNFFCVRDNAILNGFYQSPLYFEGVKDLILEEFKFSDQVESRCESQYTKIKSNNNSPICAIHFRRSDYLLKPDFHHNLTWEEYYHPAISQIAHENPGVKFLVFSDDYDWCKNNLPTEFLFHDSKDQYHDLCLMSKCDLHIIANSSFSWWGAYLANNNNKKSVIAPGRWFGKSGPLTWNTIWDPRWRVVGVNNPMTELFKSKNVMSIIHSCKIKD